MQTRHSCVCLLVVALLAAGCNNSIELSTDSPEAKKLYLEGVDLLNKFYFKEARKALEASIEQDTNFAMAYARLALVSARAGEEKTAQQVIVRAIVESAHASRYEQMLIRMWDHAIHFRYAQAAEVADSVMVLYPDVAEAYVWRGDFFEVNKDYDAAFDSYQKALQVDSAFAPAAMSLGYAYSARGDRDNALAAMERYIRLAPDAADPRASYADILFRVGRYEEALSQYRKSLDLKPDYWYSILRIGDVYTVLGRLREAESQYRQAAEADHIGGEGKATYLAYRADLELRRGNYAESLRLNGEALSLDSTNTRAQYGSAIALIRLKKFEEADQRIERIREELQRRNMMESSVMLEFYALRCRLYEEKGEIEMAFAACDSAMEYGSALGRAEVYNLLAKLYLKRDEYDGGLDMIEEALRFNPNSPSALLTLTKIYAAMGDRRMTTEIGSRLLEIWKNADTDLRDLIELKRLMARIGVRA